MEKELFVKEKETKRVLDEKYHDLFPIASFMSEYAKWFKTEESKEALKKIKEYLDKENKEYKKLYDNHHKAFFKFVDSCKHEIAVTTSPTISDCKCIICGYGLYLDKDKKKPLIIVNIDCDRDLEEIIDEVCKQLSIDTSQKLEIMSCCAIHYKNMNNIGGAFSRADFLKVIYKDYLNKKEKAENEERDLDIG